MKLKAAICMVLVKMIKSVKPRSNQRYGYNSVMDHNLSNPFPKIEPAGSLHLEFKRCGKPNCRCNNGWLHGPYIFRRWRENGRQRRQHVSMKELPAALAMINEVRAYHCTLTELKLELRDAN
jgi:hypothetical protein